MDIVLTVTPAQLIGWFLAICAGISCVAGAATAVIRAVKAARAPERKQDERITRLEGRCDKYDQYFENDKTRLDHIEEGSRVTQRAILALLRHGIDGNDVDALRAAETELHDFLLKQ